MGISDIDVASNLKYHSKDLLGLWVELQILQI